MSHSGRLGSLPSSRPTRSLGRSPRDMGRVCCTAPHKNGPLGMSCTQNYLRSSSRSQLHKTSSHGLLNSNSSQVHMLHLPWLTQLCPSLHIHGQPCKGCTLQQLHLRRIPMGMICSSPGQALKMCRSYTAVVSLNLLCNSAQLHN